MPPCYSCLGLLARFSLKGFNNSMGNKRRSSAASAGKILLVASLIGQVSVPPCFSLGLPFTSSSPKKSQILQTPVYEKLDTGSTPDTNNPSRDPSILQPDLGPVSLTDTNKPEKIRPHQLHPLNRRQNLDLLVQRRPLLTAMIRAF